MNSLRSMLAALVLAGASSIAIAADSRIVRAIQFKPGQPSLELNGRVQGERFIDYRLPAGAGQQLKASLKTASSSLYFNLLPPGSDGAAMHIGELAGAGLDRVLPDDGSYVLRVFLVRAVARRGSSADFTLSVSLNGQALKPLAAKEDALVKGTRFHAQGSIACQLPYAAARECSAGVVRRGRDGTATVELRWATSGKSQGLRRILFVKGAAVSADSPDALASSRNERGDYVIRLGDTERFDIPQALVTGG